MFDLAVAAGGEVIVVGLDLLPGYPELAGELCDLGLEGGDVGIEGGELGGGGVQLRPGRFRKTCQVYDALKGEAVGFGL